MTAVHQMLMGNNVEPPPAAPLGRYWRILITSNNSGGSGSEIGVGSIDMRESAGGPDLTSAALASTRAFSSSEFSSSYRDELGFDDSLTGQFDGWYSRATPILPEHIGWDFVDAKTIVEVEWRNLSSAYGLIGNFEIQYSNDGTSYTTKWSGTSSSGTTNATVTTTDPSP